MGTLAQSFRRHLGFKKYATGGPFNPDEPNDYYSGSSDWTGTSTQLSAEDQKLTGLKSNGWGDNNSVDNWGQNQGGGFAQGSGSDTEFTFKEGKGFDNASTQVGSSIVGAGINLGSAAFVGAATKRKNPNSEYTPDGMYRGVQSAKGIKDGWNIGSSVAGGIGGIVGAFAGGIYGMYKGNKMDKEAKQERGMKDASFKKMRLLEMQAQQYQNGDFANGNPNSQMYKMGGHLKKDKKGGAHFSDYTGNQMYKFGGPLTQNFLANQKALGGSLTPMSKNTTMATGPSHEQGGIGLPAQGAEVEGGETTSGDYVFSKALGFAKLHKPIAMSEGKIQDKPATAERITSLQKLNEKTEKLKTLQDYYKQALNLQ